MPRILGLAVLVVGVVLLVMGLSASESLSSDFSRFFTGKPTDKSLWLVAGGLGCIILGAGGWAVLGSRSARK